jgi:hypothetical protein
LRSRLAALILITSTLLNGCATRSDLALMRAEARMAELEANIAGQQDDNFVLLRALEEREAYIEHLLKTRPHSCI